MILRRASFGRRAARGPPADPTGPPGPRLAAASITVFRQGHFSTAAASSPVAAELDRVQYRQAGGPCMGAAQVVVPVSNRYLYRSAVARAERLVRTGEPPEA